MKKILLVVLIALCGVSFSFGGSIRDYCVGDCLEVKQNPIECVGDCATKGIVDTTPDARPGAEDHRRGWESAPYEAAKTPHGSR